MAEDPGFPRPLDPHQGEHFGDHWLPVKPNSETGQPLPPHAPGYMRAGKGTPEHGRGRDTTNSRKPRPPAGQGPTLVWYRASKRKAVIFAIGLFVFVGIFLFISRGFQVNWLPYWQVWVALIFFAVLMYFSAKAANCAAGVEWVMEGKSWVRVYELKSIKAYTYSNDLNLHLIDADGRKMQVSVTLLQSDRQIWDLTYNGILHSAIKNGAETNQLARGTLKLPREG